jgi:hypothetical protein
MPLLTTCAQCGATFTPRRSTARYCSDRCRVAAHRAAHPAPDPLERAREVLAQALAREGPQGATAAWMRGVLGEPSRNGNATAGGPFPFTDPRAAILEADARLLGLSIDAVRAFKARHNMPRDQRLSPEALDLLRSEHREQAAAQQADRQQATEAVAAVQRRLTPALADAIAGAVARLRVSPFLLEQYLLTGSAAFTTSQARAGAMRALSKRFPVAARAAATLGPELRAAYWGVVVRLGQLQGDPPADAGEFLRWSRLEVYIEHDRSTSRTPGDGTFIGTFAAMGADRSARTLLGLPATGPITRKAVRDAFRSVSPEHHPDRGGDADRFAAMVEARDRLLRIAAA